MFNHYSHLIESGQVNEGEAYNLALYLLDPKTSLDQQVHLLSQLSLDTVTVDMVYGMVRGLMSTCKLTLNHSLAAMDLCGTGGDGHQTFNISTTVALVLSDFIPIIKHGNGSITSRSGSSDLLKALAIEPAQSHQEVEEQLEKDQIAFLHAPQIYPAMKHIQAARRSLTRPSVFNILGPLCNPYTLDSQLIGVYDSKVMPLMAKVLIKRGLKRAAIVHGHQGMDELSTTGPNQVILVDQEKIRHMVLDPLDYGISRARLEDLKGGSPDLNRRITLDILAGQPGPHQDIVALNAGFALYVNGYARDIASGIQTIYQYLRDRS